MSETTVPQRVPVEWHDPRTTWRTSVHGGSAATLLHFPLGCAVHSTLPAGVDCRTVDV